MNILRSALLAADYKRRRRRSRDTRSLCLGLLEWMQGFAEDCLDEIALLRADVSNADNSDFAEDRFTRSGNEQADLYQFRPGAGTYHQNTTGPGLRDDARRPS